MAKNSKDNKKVFIALIVAMAVICGLLIGAIIGVVMKKDDASSEESTLAEETTITEETTLAEETTAAEKLTAAAEEESYAIPTDILTKYYWDGSVQSNTVYRFFEDGTYAEYFYEKNLNEKFNPEFLTENPDRGFRYEVKNNKLYMYWEYAGEVSSVQYEWISADSEKIYDSWVKDRCRDSDYIFYETSWKQDELGIGNASYLRKLELISGKTDKADTPAVTDEAAVYTQYLKNGGYEKFDSYEYADSISDLTLSTCLVDIDNNGTSELLVCIESDNFGVRGPEQTYELLTINNGKVRTAIHAFYGGGSGGGEILRFKYDNRAGKYAVAKETDTRNGAMEIYLDNEYYYSDNGFSSPSETLSQGIFDPQFMASAVETIKGETDLWETDDSGIFRYYKCNGNYISAEEYTSEYDNYTDVSDGKFALVEATFEKPIK